MPEDTYLSEMVDCSGDWATPWGLASQMRPCSEASATNVFCAKAKRQRQLFYL